VRSIANWKAASSQIDKVSWRKWQPTSRLNLVEHILVAGYKKTPAPFFFPRSPIMYAKSSKPDTVTLTVLLFALGTLLTATVNVMLG